MRKTLRRKIEQFTFSISRGGGKREQIRGKIKKRKKEKNYFQPAGEEERRRARWQGRSWTCSSRRSTTCSPRCTTGWKQSTQVREQTNKKQQRKRFVAVISWRLLRTGKYGIGIYVKQICVGVLGFSLNIEISFPHPKNMNSHAAAADNYLIQWVNTLCWWDLSQAAVTCQLLCTIKCNQICTNRHNEEIGI